MSLKEHYDCHVVRIRYIDGQRLTDRKRLQVPWLMATGNIGRCSDLQIREAVNDLFAEMMRREGSS